MEKFFSKISRGASSSSGSNANESVEKRPRVQVEFNSIDIPSDPGLRKPIEEYDISIRDQVRREYLTRGPCQPIGHIYPKKTFGNYKRSFRDDWYKKFTWLEYSISKDAIYCFWCYLFKETYKGGRYGEEAFTKIGFNNWKKMTEKCEQHVGAPNSCHNYARIEFESFQDQRHSVANMFRTNIREMDAAYRTRLTASLDCVRFLLQQGMAFRGHDESTSSSNRGNFLEMIHWYCQRCPEVDKVMGQNAPGNNQMLAPSIQKQLAHACASETTRVIINDLGDKFFTILVDEARPGDTRWGSHYLTLIRLCDLWPSVEHVLEKVRDDSPSSQVRGTARGLLDKMNSYEFVFILHLMRYILEITHELSLALQQKDQNIVQAISLIDTVKERLQLFVN